MPALGEHNAAELRNLQAEQDGQVVPVDWRTLLSELSPLPQDTTSILARWFSPVSPSASSCYPEDAPALVLPAARCLMAPLRWDFPQPLVHEPQKWKETFSSQTNKRIPSLDGKGHCVGNSPGLLLKAARRSRN